MRDTAEMETKRSKKSKKSKEEKKQDQEEDDQEEEEEEKVEEELADQQNTAFKKLARIRQYKKQISATLEGLNQRGEENVDTEKKKQLQSALDNFTQQEEQYIAVARKIIAMRKQAEKSDGNRAAESAEEGRLNLEEPEVTTDEVAELEALKQQREFLKHMLQQQKMMHAMQAHQKLVTIQQQNDAATVAKHRQNAIDRVAHEMDEVTAKKAELAELKEKVRQKNAQNPAAASSEVVVDETDDSESTDRIRQLGDKLAELRSQKGAIDAFVEDMQASADEQARKATAAFEEKTKTPEQNTNTSGQNTNTESENVVANEEALRDQLKKLTDTKDRLFSLQSMVKKVQDAEGRGEDVPDELKDRLKQLTNDIGESIEAGEVPNSESVLTSEEEKLQKDKLEFDQKVREQHSVFETLEKEREKLAEIKNHLIELNNRAENETDKVDYETQHLETPLQNPSHNSKSSESSAQTKELQLDYHLASIRQLFDSANVTAFGPNFWLQQQQMTLQQLQQQLHCQQLQMQQLQQMFMQMQLSQRVDASQAPTVICYGARKRSTATNASMETEEREAEESKKVLKHASRNINRAKKGKTSRTAEHSFEQCREEIYTEVAALVAQNEQRPAFLIDLFKELQLLTNGHLQESALTAVRGVLKGNLTAENMGGEIEGKDNAKKQQEKEIVQASTPSRHITQQQATTTEEKLARKLAEKMVIGKRRRRSPRNRMPSNDSTSSAGEFLQNMLEMKFRKRDENEAQFDQSVELFLQELHKFLDQHRGLRCNSKLLVELREKTMAMAETNCLADGGSDAEFFRRQLSSLLDDTLAKFCGQRVDNAEAELLADVGEALRNELAFFTLMRKIDNADAKSVQAENKLRRQSLMLDTEKELRVMESQSRSRRNTPQRPLSVSTPPTTPIPTEQTEEQLEQKQKETKDKKEEEEEHKGKEEEDKEEEKEAKKESSEEGNWEEVTSVGSDVIDEDDVSVASSKRQKKKEEKK